MKSPQVGKALLNRWMYTDQSWIENSYGQGKRIPTIRQ